MGGSLSADVIVGMATLVSPEPLLPRSTISGGGFTITTGEQTVRRSLTNESAHDSYLRLSFSTHAPTPSHKLIFHITRYHRLKFIPCDDLDHTADEAPLLAPHKKHGLHDTVPTSISKPLNFKSPLHKILTHSLYLQARYPVATL